MKKTIIVFLLSLLFFDNVLAQDNIKIKIKSYSKIILPFQSAIKLKVKFINLSDTLTTVLSNIDILQLKMDTLKDNQSEFPELSIVFIDKNGVVFKHPLCVHLNVLKRRKHNLRNNSNSSIECNTLTLKPKQSVVRKYAFDLINENTFYGWYRFNIVLTSGSNVNLDIAKESELNSMLFEGYTESEFKNFFNFNIQFGYH